MNKTTKTSISILFTILLSYGLVSAWTNLTTVSTGNSLTATIWNDMVTKINDIGSRTDGIHNSGGNIGIGTVSPSQMLEVNGNVRINGDISGIGMIKTVIASACIGGVNATGGSFITTTTTSGQNCTTACSNVVASTCAWGVTFWGGGTYYGYNYECSSGVTFQQSSTGYLCCCRQVAGATNPIR